MLFKNSGSRDFNLEMQAGRLVGGSSGPRLVLPSWVCVGFFTHHPEREETERSWAIRELLFPWTVPILDKWLVWRGPPSEPLYWDTIRPGNINTPNCILLPSYFLPSYLMNILSHHKMANGSVLEICILIVLKGGYTSWTSINMSPHVLCCKHSGGPSRMPTLDMHKLYTPI